ncbi:MAG: sulfatase [bacterium]
MSARDRGPKDTGPDAIPAFLRFVMVAIVGAFVVGIGRGLATAGAERYLSLGLKHVALLTITTEASHAVGWAARAAFVAGVPALLASFFFNKSFSIVALVLSIFPAHDLARRATAANPDAFAAKFRLLLGNAASADAYASATLITAVAALAFIAIPMRSICASRRVSTSLLAALAITGAILPATTRGIARALHRATGPNVVIITIDTLRADHMSAYGYPRLTSPVLDALARRGVLFENALTPTPRTTQAIASMMTSLYPQTHGIRTLWGTLPRTRVTLAERFRDAGYLTAGFWTTTFLDEKRGLAQGFDAYENTSVESDRAELVTDRAILWLAEKVGPRPDRGRKDKRRPFFLWLHYRDPHMPYNPPPEERVFVDRLYNGEFRDAVRFYPSKELMVYNHLGLIDSSDVVQAAALYDGEIRYADRQIGRLFKDLDDRALTENTIIAVTADHGEGLSEHGYYFDHGDLLYDSSVKIPLILAGPEIPAARVAQQASLIDVAPTIAQMSGLQWRGEMEGRDLSTAIAEAAAGRTTSEPARVLFGESGENLLGAFNIFRFVDGIEGKMRSARSDRWKLTMLPKPGGVRDYALYDLALDPAESTNVLTEQPVVLEELTTMLNEFLRDAGTMGDDSKIGDVDEETQEKLRAMGYLR